MQRRVWRTSFEALRDLFGGDIQHYLWRRIVVSCDEAENAFVYAMMELAAVWAFWNMVSPEKEEQTVRIELIGQDLFKYEGDRIEKVGSMLDAKD